MDSLTPKDHAEAVALFRSEVIGALARRELDRGELRAALVEISGQRFRPPGSEHTRSFSVPTLERWYYRYRAGGLAALRPRPRSDQGRARELTDEQRELVCDIRREHPSASVPLILRTLVADGRLEKGAVSQAGVLDAKLLRACLLWTVAGKSFFHSTSPSWVRTAKSDLVPVAGSALPTNSFSPQITGEPWPTPGNSIFQFRSLSVHWAGMVVVSLSPVPLGPRKRVHSWAERLAAKTPRTSRIESRRVMRRDLGRASLAGE